MVNGELGLDTYKILARELDQGDSAAIMFMGSDNKREGIGKVCRDQKKVQAFTHFSLCHYDAVCWLNI